ncbi:MAG: DUF3791 domain-containing protein [Lachnospiraceae bacterium]|nr:DUF3791 domain-containing protein [Lachnospiraceae bacterium]
MINEVLFMEARIFSDYCNLKHLSATKANAIFNKCGIWDYIEACYDTLHMNAFMILIPECGKKDRIISEIL